MPNASSLGIREVFLFVLVSLALSVGVYRESLWGNALLAPLDLGPAFFQNYRFMDPATHQVPDNHYIIDQFAYDLPLQKTIYDAYRAGEIPWWDPYTYGGRPLLADAHINGTDPIRLACYLLLPFEWAYNWNYALRGIITGLGMFLLLRYFQIEVIASIVLALTYQFGGWFTMYFGHPWIQASFMYYPFLWLVWLKAVRGGLGRHDALGGILCALIFWAGNLQSHAYLPLFAACFLSGLIFKNRSQFWRGLRITGISGITGALLAFPVLANQVEFFLLSVRSIESTSQHLLNPAAIPVSLCSIHPWLLGTFKTLDAGKLLGSSGYAFNLFCGGAVFILAILGGGSLLRGKNLLGMVVAQSLLIVGLYLVVISTPLSKILYPRMAGMPGMAIILLAGLAWNHWKNLGELITPRIARGCLAVFGTGLILSTIAILALFPQVQPKIESKLSKMGVGGTSGLATIALRQAQIRRIPSEITLLNPEALVGFTAVILILAGLAFPRSPHQKKLMLGALIFGALATISFHHRFRPKHDIALWNRLKEGGPLQKKAIDALRGGLRLEESAVTSGNLIFPYAMAALYRVHVIHGYSALQTKSIANYQGPDNSIGFDARADYTYSQADTLTKTRDLTPSRFRSSPRGKFVPTDVLSESQNSLSIKVDPVQEDNKIVRTDTFYPGWTLAEVPAFKAQTYGYSFSSWPMPPPNNPMMTFSYKPSTSSLWPWGLSTGACLLGVMFWQESKNKKA